MLSLIRSPWFATSIAVLLAVTGLLLPGERMWLFGMAGTAAFWGLIDWIGTNREDGRNVR